MVMLRKECWYRLAGRIVIAIIFLGNQEVRMSDSQHLWAEAPLASSGISFPRNSGTSLYRSRTGFYHDNQRSTGGPTFLPEVYQVSHSAEKAGILDGACAIPQLNPCIPEAKCVVSAPVVGKATCKCPPGYGGDGIRPSLGGQGCVNIDECRSGLHDCDLATQECRDIQGSYECLCKPGFAATPSGRACIDINECEHPSLNNCDPAITICHNLEGSYRCDCLDPSEIFDERTGRCRDLDECTELNGAMNPCKQICINRVGGVLCSCFPGYRLQEDGISCEDIDECSNIHLHTCDPVGIISRCVNTDGSYMCICNRRLGYQNSDDNQSCVNFDECAEFPYLCGGASSCCKDLPPPMKFACTAPIDSQGRIFPLNSLNSMPLTSAPIDQITQNGLLYSSSSSVLLPNISQTDPLQSSIIGYYPSIAQTFTRSSLYPDQRSLLKNFSDYNEELRMVPLRILKSLVPAGEDAELTSEGDLNWPRRLQQSLILSSLGSELPLINFLSPLRIGRGYVCPVGFTLGADLYKSKVRKAAMETVKHIFSNGDKSSDASSGESINPEDITEGIIWNANAITSKISKWYHELSSLPLKLSTSDVINNFASGTTSASLSPSRTER